MGDAARRKCTYDTLRRIFLYLYAVLKAFYREGVVEAGCDEAGRGCLAGPVFAAAVVLPEGFSHPLLNDSKQMTRRDRDTLREIIEVKPSLGPSRASRRSASTR